MLSRQINSTNGIGITNSKINYFNSNRTKLIRIIKIYAYSIHLIVYSLDQKSCWFLLLSSNSTHYSDLGNSQ